MNPYSLLLLKSVFKVSFLFHCAYERRTHYLIKSFYIVLVLFTLLSSSLCAPLAQPTHKDLSSSTTSQFQPLSSLSPPHSTSKLNFVPSHRHVSVLHPPDSVKAVGRQQWEQLLSSGAKEVESENGSSCWHVAVARFRELSTECNTATENMKTLLSLVLTRCHFMNRGKKNGGFPMEKDECDLDYVFETMRATDGSGEPDRDAESEGKEDGKNKNMNIIESLETLPSSDLKSALKLCLSHLSDSAFEVYIQFFNHLDNICFFLHSQVWQERTEETVNRLAYISTEVVGKLDEVHRQHSILLQQQRLALKHQEHLLIGSKRLEEALDSGHSQLQFVFTDMRNEVQKEQKRLVSIFDDTFRLISRVLHIQQTIAGRLSDFETVLTYIGLIITTFYLTAADSTRSARATLYALWTFMLLSEVLFWRLSLYCASWGFNFGDINHLRLVTRRWRLFCISIGVFQWISAWWIHRDSTRVIVDALQNGLKELKEQIQTANSAMISLHSTEPKIPTTSQGFSDYEPHYNGPRLGRITSLYSTPTYRDIFDYGEENELLDPDYQPSLSSESSSSRMLSSEEGTHDEDVESLVSGDWSVMNGSPDKSQSDTGREVIEESYRKLPQVLLGTTWCSKDRIKEDCDFPIHNPALGCTKTLSPPEHDIAQNNFMGRRNPHEEGFLKSRSSSSVPPSRCHRSNHFRHARPIMNRAPIPGVSEDLKYFKLNPVLLFETEDDFAETYAEFIQLLKRGRRHSSRRSPSLNLPLRHQKGSPQRYANSDRGQELSSLSDDHQISISSSNVLRQNILVDQKLRCPPEQQSRLPQIFKSSEIIYSNTIDSEACSPLSVERVSPKHVLPKPFPVSTTSILRSRPFFSPFSFEPFIKDETQSRFIIYSKQYLSPPISIDQQEDMSDSVETSSLPNLIQSPNIFSDLKAPQNFETVNGITVPDRGKTKPSIKESTSQSNISGRILRKRPRRADDALSQVETPKANKFITPKTTFTVETDNVCSDMLMKTPRRRQSRQKGRSDSATSTSAESKNLNKAHKEIRKTRAKPKAKPNALFSITEFVEQKQPGPRAKRKNNSRMKVDGTDVLENMKMNGASKESKGVTCHAHNTVVPSKRRRNASKKEQSGVKSVRMQKEISEGNASADVITTPKPKKRVYVATNESSTNDTIVIT